MDGYLTLVNQLASYDEEVRLTAMRKIMASPREPTVAALRAILEGNVPGNWNPRARVYVAAILATWKDEQTGKVDKGGLPELIEALRGPDPGLRKIAAEALPSLGRDAVDGIKDVLVSGNTASRTEAAVILGRMLHENQEPAAGLALLKANLKDEESPDVRMAVVINLAEWESHDAIEGLIDALTDPDELIRGFAWQRIAERAKPPVAFNPDDDFAPRAEAIQKLRAWWKEHRR